jgi:hypothetical protein
LHVVAGGEGCVKKKTIETRGKAYLAGKVVSNVLDGVG